jgi:bifunctional non-homologous end joining protein LigD
MNGRAANRVRVEVVGRTLTLSNLDKVLYPATGTTKAEVIRYYTAVAPAMLPHLRDRPVTLVRAPDGVDGQWFFEKRCPSGAPDWLRAGGPQHGALVDETAALVWLANLAAIELHVHQHRLDAPTNATSVVFDLDPGPGVGILECAEIAFRLRDAVTPLGLTPYIKTSGSKGLHLFVPVDPGTTAEHAKAFAKAVGDALAKHSPTEVTTSMAKTDRPGRVFVDWSQNDDAKTTVAPYSLRLRERPTVSTPITWDEAQAAADAHDANQLSFDIDDVRERVAAIGDLWAAVESGTARLPKV